MRKKYTAVAAGAILGCLVRSCLGDRRFCRVRRGRGVCCRSCSFSQFRGVSRFRR